MKYASTSTGNRNWEKIESRTKTIENEIAAKKRQQQKKELTETQMESMRETWSTVTTELPLCFPSSIHLTNCVPSRERSNRVDSSACHWSALTQCTKSASLFRPFVFIPENRQPNGERVTIFSNLNTLLTQNKCSHSSLSSSPTNQNGKQLHGIH